MCNYEIKAQLNSNTNMKITTSPCNRLVLSYLYKECNLSEVIMLRSWKVDLSYPTAQNVGRFH